MIEWGESGWNSDGPCKWSGVWQGINISGFWISFKEKEIFDFHIGSFRYDSWEIKSLEAAKSKAEELLTEWLTTAIKDLPEDKLAELGVMRIPECKRFGSYLGYCKDEECPHYNGPPDECPDNPNSIASIKRGGSDNGK